MYTLYGALASPYSMKLRAVLRYRRIVHIWRHGAEAMQLAGTKVKAPVIPVIQYPDGSYHNDTTPVIYDLESREEGRSIIPPDPARAFLAHLIEDFADEWLTKAMFGYRWLKEVDQIQMSRWLAFDSMKGGGRENSEAYAEQFRNRQVGRMAIVGCTEENFPLIRATTNAVLDALEAHVTDQHCLFGTRPSLAEFGMYGQLSQLGVDPTAQTMMRADYPYSMRWLLHIDDMSGVEGEWDDADADLRPVVHALLQQVGRVYAPFLLANAAALQKGDTTFSITVDGMEYSQGTFKYQAKCLVDLRTRYAALQGDDRAKVDAALADTGCIEMLS
ncbi:glutathione S-transferase N-terminal domain-containing protein [Alterisphingorhabdus coralli]|uniref:Glutathione S-transferase C-terminal domain-containing protein n=1 Tax=Alterisphingorhabdus coralli TaxID=3071408 RepID=A0AA97I0H2_9SPHN|nr:glutathione S-transferase N-terminal domain-containing protein [Parasphingorhabdus sp. SCSIO 66989]WOE74388.1 glutathione S-transferase C-terminal domain-containing protein [Parasphingorhabdus sp. SCSIO 66989]